MEHAKKREKQEINSDNLQENVIRYDLRFTKCKICRPEYEVETRTRYV